MCDQAARRWPFILKEMAMRCRVLVFIGVLSLTVVSCGGGGSSGDTDTAGNGTIVTSQAVIGPGPECTYGGVAIEVGIDENGNGVLDSPGEVDSTEYVCNGADGAPGHNALVEINSVAPGATCDSGGFRVDVGTDSNSNNDLETGEVTSTEFICNGTSLVIMDLAPSSGRTGEEITISGAGFGSVQGTVMVGGAAADTIISWSATEIVAAVPSGAATGFVTVTVDGVTSNPAQFTLLWSLSSPENVAVVSTVENQYLPRITSDGAGGAIIAWNDIRGGGVNDDIYAQRVDNTGTVLWTHNGVPVAATALDQRDVVLTDDNMGGAILAWDDYRASNWDVYAQRLDADGSSQWTVNGTGVATGASRQSQAAIASDGSGGAIIVWRDDRDSGVTGFDIYAQRIDSSGSALWTPSGVLITNAADTQQYPRIVPDGAGGAIVTWEDGRDSATTSQDIYAQKIGASGLVAWATNGVVICDASQPQVGPEIAPDGSGGAYIVWEDGRNGYSDMVFNHVSAGGLTAYGGTGYYLNAYYNNEDKIDPAIASDGAGGAIIAWIDYRSGNHFDVYAQKVNASYETPLLWSSRGLEVSTGLQGHGAPSVVGDGTGGAIITWSDGDIVGQRIDQRGVLRWGPNGMIISPLAGSVSGPQVVSDGNGGAVVVWDKNTGGSLGDDIYAQGVSADGE